MSDRVIFDTNAINDLTESLKKSIESIDSNVKQDVTNMFSIFKELNIFDNEINVVNLELNEVQDDLYGISVKLANHSNICEKSLNNVKKHIDSISIIGDNTVTNVVVNSSYNEIKLNDISYDKEVTSGNNNVDIEIGDDIVYEDTNSVHLENINDDTIIPYIVGE